jgi:hypothetical protein
MKRYRHKVQPLGMEYAAIQASIDRLHEQGWTLLSTYVDVNRNTVGKEPTVVGVFQTWEKVRR